MTSVTRCSALCSLMRCGAAVLLAASLFQISGLLAAQAQSAAPAPDAAPGASTRAPDAGLRTYVPGVEILPVAGMPFTAKDTIAWTRYANGGAPVTTYLEANAVRDNEGRVYRERHHFGPAGTDPQTTIFESNMLDPVAQTRTTCFYDLRRCFVSTYHPRVANLIERPAVRVDGGNRTFAKESLGSKTIEDLQVTGTRETTTVAPGARGNEQALVYTNEYWYSDELKTNIQVTRKNPLEGTQAVKLNISSRAEPDPAFFAPPEGFTVTDSRSADHPAN